MSWVWNTASPRVIDRDYPHGPVHRVECLGHDPGIPAECDWVRDDYHLEEYCWRAGSETWS